MRAPTLFVVALLAGLVAGMAAFGANILMTLWANQNQQQSQQGITGFQ